MVVNENCCCDCAVPGYPCIHCRLENYPVFYCDKCGDEVDTLYWLDGQQLCRDCVLDSLEEVEIYG